MRLLCLAVCLVLFASVSGLLSSSKRKERDHKQVKFVVRLVRQSTV